jgi:hypothetical protein
MAPSRSDEFSTGKNSGPQEPASLQQRAARFNELNPQRFKPNGLNQQIMPSANGMSGKDAARQTPNGMLETDNGMSASTYQKLIPQYGMNLSL